MESEEAVVSVPISTADKWDRELWRAYYLLQYERIGNHEASRLQVSSFVVAGSVVAFGLCVQADVSRWLLIVTFAAVIATNFIALLWARTCRRWVKLHQARAEASWDAWIATSCACRSL